MTFGKLWLPLILMALLALGTACEQTPAPMPTVQPTPRATVSPMPTLALTPTPTAKPWPTHWPTRAPRPTPTHPQSPEPTSTQFPRGTPPYPFPEETRAIGDHHDGESWRTYDDSGSITGWDGNPITIYGCFIGYTSFGTPLFTHTGETSFDPKIEIIRVPIANVGRFEIPQEILEEGHCYKMAVISTGAGLRYTTDLTRARAPKFEPYGYQLIHPNMWRWCGRAPLPDLADIDC